MRYTIIFFLVLAAAACKKEPEEVEENDVITTVKLTLKDTATGVSSNYYFRDLDGEGGNNPAIDTLLLTANTYYETQLDFTNERQSPPQSVTAEINTNKEEHQIFYKSTPAAALQMISYKDADDNGKPLGLKASFKTQNTAEFGSLKIILRHNLNKSGVNVSTGDITNAGGESEVEIDLPFDIE